MLTRSVRFQCSLFCVHPRLLLEGRELENTERAGAFCETSGTPDKAGADVADVVLMELVENPTSFSTPIGHGTNTPPGPPWRNTPYLPKCGNQIVQQQSEQDTGFVATVGRIW